MNERQLHDSLLTIVGSIFSIVFYALSAGGGARLAALAFFGLMGAGEAHHLIEAAASASYDPGCITAVPYAWYGWRLLGAVWQEWSAGSHAEQSLQLEHVEVKLR